MLDRAKLLIPREPRALLPVVIQGRHKWACVGPMPSTGMGLLYGQEHWAGSFGTARIISPNVITFPGVMLKILSRVKKTASNSDAPFLE